MPQFRCGSGCKTVLGVVSESPSELSIAIHSCIALNGPMGLFVFYMEWLGTFRQWSHLELTRVLAGCSLPFYEWYPENTKKNKYKTNNEKTWDADTNMR